MCNKPVSEVKEAVPSFNVSTEPVPVNSISRPILSSLSPKWRCDHIVLILRHFLQKFKNSNRIDSKYLNSRMSWSLFNRRFSNNINSNPFWKTTFIYNIVSNLTSLITDHWNLLKAVLKGGRPIGFGSQVYKAGVVLTLGNCELWGFHILIGNFCKAALIHYGWIDCLFASVLPLYPLTVWL